MMMIPRRNDFDLFEDMFGDAFFTKGESKLMKTDIKEKKDKQIIDVDLPGYEKDGIKLNIQEGYLTIHATVNKEEKDEEKLKILEEAIAFRNVANMPARVRCALLAWHTIEDMLEKVKKD